MLEFHQMSLAFENRCIFNAFSLSIDEPRILLTGANGSGKTTLLMLAAGLLSPNEGRVTFNGQLVDSVNAKRNIGISANKVLLPEFMTVQALLEFHCGQFQCELDKEWL